MIGFDYELVYGCVPLIEGPIAFFEERKSRWPPNAVERLFDEHASKTWAELAVLIGSAERVELWIDPDPNAQLKLLQLLPWIAGRRDLAVKTSLFQLDIRLGELPPEETRRINPTLSPITSRNENLARAGWQAFGQATPEAWCNLLKRKDVTELSMLHRSILRVLQELPETRSGLSSTQRKVLTLIANGAATPLAIYSDASMNFGNSMYSYWRHGEILDELARCNVPAIAGLPNEVFSMELHDDAERLRRYQRSTISLTDFGVALLAGEADFAALNSVDRWWGGTRLTNENLWRWDEGSGALLAP